MWPAGIKHPGRKVDDFVSFIDFSPTFLELANIGEEEANMQPFTGRSISDILFSDKSGKVDPSRNAVLIGKERHDVGRPNDWGYPIRGIVTDDYLYLHNFEPDRWPVGNPETGYLNTDGSPTKTLILNHRRETGSKEYWGPNFGKRPQEELYQISKDPDCMDNLAIHPEYQAVKEELKESLFAQLKDQGDPRMFGEGHIFDEYEYFGEAANGFYERYMEGEEINSGWVNETDFEKDFEKNEQ
jgi:arylsulfatase A-like enzyme